jgi:hypothetical protein
VPSAASDPSSEHGIIPRWLLAFTTLGAAVLMLAVEWDFSWHRSVGRDTFFTPPHVLLYAGALSSCVAAATAILRSGWPKSVVTRGVRVWGFEAPLGAFAVAWGGLVMLAGGVFDDWWHGVYGLDIAIQSVPHVVIGVGGLLAIFVGNLLLAASRANGARVPGRASSALVVFAGGVLLTLALVVNVEELFVYLMHGARFYCIVAATVPLIAFGVGGATNERFGPTYVTLVYTTLSLLLIAVLPLVPAEPRLGPILHRVSHFVPPPFPLLVAPAVALTDWLAPRFRHRSSGVRSALDGALFCAAFTLLTWPFASFLQTPYADNRVFVGNEFAFFQAETSYPLRHQFYPTETSASAFWSGMALALALAVLSSRLGLGASRFLRRVRR